MFSGNNVLWLGGAEDSSVEELRRDIDALIDEIEGVRVSRLGELVNELCPDGVEYRKFGEVYTLHARIGRQKLTKRGHQSSGDYLLVTGGECEHHHRNGRHREQRVKRQTVEA